MSTTVRVRDLVGHDVAGKLANVTCPIYRDQYANDPKNCGGRIRKLIAAKIKRDKGHNWLYLFWDRDTSDMSDCGYSGWREDTADDPTVEILEEYSAVQNWTPGTARMQRGGTVVT